MMNIFLLFLFCTSFCFKGIIVAHYANQYCQGSMLNDGLGVEYFIENMCVSQYTGWSAYFTPIDSNHVNATKYLTDGSCNGTSETVTLELNKCVLNPDEHTQAMRITEIQSDDADTTLQNYLVNCNKHQHPKEAVCELVEYVNSEVCTGTILTAKLVLGEICNYMCEWSKTKGISLVYKCSKY